MVEDAVGRVRERGRAGRVGADDVALDQVARRAGAGDSMQTPRRSCSPEMTLPDDRVARRAVVDPDPVRPRCRSRPRPVDVDADLVALDQVARSEPVPVIAIAVAGVARDHVAGPGRRPADRVARRVLHGRTPPSPLARAVRPLESVPIRLPWRRLPEPAAMFTPKPTLSEITLPAPAAVPPTVTPVDPSRKIPSAAVAEVDRAEADPAPGGRDPDEVALDQLVVRARGAH